jgi:electron transfer flavoprotein alpha subunit
MGDVLAFAEQRDGQIRAGSHEVVSAAARAAEGLGGVGRALVLGAPGVAATAAGLGAYGAEVVHVAEDDSLGDFVPEVYAAVIADVVRGGGYASVVFTATAQGKDLAPRVAALLDVPLATDVTGIDTDAGSVTVRRPIYAGKAFARVVMDASPAVISIRPNVFGTGEHSAAGTVESLTPEVPKAQTRVVEFKAAEGSSVDVSEASIVVSGGRGMRDPEHWNLLEDLRDAFGPEAALGASRAVVDAGWRPHAEQVGQTGKTVAPKLYVAVGISGAIQHLAGMRTSQTIVAVNKDPDAPIFGVADYGIVGDAFEVLPRLIEAVSELRDGS